MSRHNDACSHLEWMLGLGAITGWVDIDPCHFKVITADGKAHTWTTREVITFYAGFCAGRSYVYRLGSTCAYPSSPSPAEVADGSLPPISAKLTPRRWT